MARASGRTPTNPDFLEITAAQEVERRGAKQAVEHMRESIAASPQRRALSFDLNDALHDVAEHPDGVAIPAGLAENLRRIRLGLSGALAIVSGRLLADIGRFLHPSGFDAAAHRSATRRRRAESICGFAFRVAAEPFGRKRTVFRSRERIRDCIANLAGDFRAGAAAASS